MDHYIVEFASSDWLYGWFVVLLLGVLVLGVFPRIKSFNFRTFELVWGGLLLAMISVEHHTMIQTGVWHTSFSLPLQMCSLSGLLFIYTLWFRNKWTYLFVLFWGLSGGLHSFLTPEHTFGGQGLFFWTYNFWHASIMVGPLYFFFIQKWGLPKRSFITVWGLTHLVWVAIGLIDWALGANYMYVLEPPAADNPLIIGEFPYHLIGFEIAGFVHFGLVALLFSRIQKRPGYLSIKWTSA